MNRILVSCSGLADPSWKDSFAAFCGKALIVMGIDNWEVSLLLCNDGVIGELNRQYRGVDMPTDVLAFRQDSGICPSAVSPHPVGDVVIAVDVMKRQAKQYGVSKEAELKRLAVHGLLHLSGMEHGKEDGTMIRRQEEILRQLLEETIF